MRAEMRIIVSASLLFLSFLASPPVLPDTLYVRSYKIRLTESPNRNSKKLLVLKRGDKVKKLDAQKNWIKIRYKKTEGWLNRLALSKKPPKRRVSLFAKKIDITSRARKRASTFTSAAAARGLMDSGNGKLVAEKGPDFVALAKIEGVRVDIEEAIAYINDEE